MQRALAIQILGIASLVSQRTRRQGIGGDYGESGHLSKDDRQRDSNSKDGRRRK